jgi:hypothetical protein
VKLKRKLCRHVKSATEVSFCLIFLPRTDGQDEDWRENDAELEPSSDVGGGVPTCRRHKLEVNFADIGWSHWIISPQKFEAHYCAGSCPFPLTKVSNTPYESGSQICHCTVTRPQQMAQSQDHTAVLTHASCMNNITKKAGFSLCLVY